MTVPNLITVLICTHNRTALLSRVLDSLNNAKRSLGGTEILVVANACTDGTHAMLDAYINDRRDRLPLRWIAEATPGKSNALNRAIPEISTKLTAFVDDDHRVDENYLVAIEAANERWPEAALYCGRILPDWDGTEQNWVHDEGPYRIYPLPVPRYDQGTEPRTITPEEGPIPGGGNLIVQRHVFGLAGRFSTDLGPHGHDLGGGEDSEYVLRAMARGSRCQYAPDILQHHYVDAERLRLNYLLRKSYQRTRSTARIQGNGHVPLYMWRKLAEYSFHSLFSLSWQKRRFYWVRSAAALGEIAGRRESGHRGKGLELPPDRGMVIAMVLGLLTLASAVVAWVAGGDDRMDALLPVLGVAAGGTVALLGMSLRNFSQTGPQIRKEILTHYGRYTLFALARLSLWAFALMLFSGGMGVLVYDLHGVIVDENWSPWFAALAAGLGVLGIAGLQFVRTLRFNPGLLATSMHYRMSRFYVLWDWFTPSNIRLVQGVLASCLLLLAIVASTELARQGDWARLVSFWSVLASYAGVITFAAWMPEAQPRPAPKTSTGRAPNILMIGSDTLRADRLGAFNYRRSLTPNIDALGAQGVLFKNCYVPCARTAPSLVSLLTGTWPHTHGIRDNFIADAEVRLRVPALPQLLKHLDYRTAAISDWCGSDMGKFGFGFDYTDLPEDQWNLKYLIRQGPKDLRLYVSLFTHNRLGRLLLPELYYLGGVPLTSQMGKCARRLVSRLAAGGEPFFLNVFYSTTHPPFASEWPWYTHFGDPKYSGESKFAMSKLTDPFEIIRRQGAPKEEFDLDQIIDLYDGCVAQFDDEVGRMLRHIEACGLATNTIVVVYSDHGMEFFEHDTWGQGNSAIGDFSPRVPLVIRDPRKPPGGTIDAVVRSIDLAPTLLELAGASPAQGMDGISLAGSLTQPALCPELEAYNETGVWITEVPGLPEKHLRYPDLLELMEVPDSESGTLALKLQYRDTILNAKDRMIRSGPWKLVTQPLVDGSRTMLFNVNEDPGCTRDCSLEFPEISARLSQTLQNWMGATSST